MKNQQLTDYSACYNCTAQNTLLSTSGRGKPVTRAVHTPDCLCSSSIKYWGQTVLSAAVQAASCCCPLQHRRIVEAWWPRNTAAETGEGCSVTDAFHMHPQHPQQPLTDGWNVVVRRTEHLVERNPFSNAEITMCGWSYAFHSVFSHHTKKIYEEYRES